MNPVARRDDLVVEQDTGDLFIHDLKREKHICLNPVSAFVWKKCDGEHNADDIARDLEQEIGVKVSTGLINSTFDRLFYDRLLDRHPTFI